ncbi:hypothetical protein ACE193_24580 [Bernardetia sp. OM2101]|uniref:hypothetical protein n=1 Tax=Bernardetia sp. OM2101 TaxID=3344876 RepID=UPI0035CE9466
MKKLLEMNCPYCKETVLPSFSDVSYSYPSHGGDYEWKETGGKATCPTCNKISEVRVQIDLETGKIWELVKVYPPKNK